VVASAAEAEYATLHTVGSRVLWIRTILDSLGFPQPTSPGTPLFTDNDCARGIAHRLTKLRRTKALDVRLHWIRDKVDLGLIEVMRCDGVTNPADFLTKGHPAAHVRRIAGIFVDTPTLPVGTVLPVAQTAAQLRASRRCPPEPVLAPFRFAGFEQESPKPVHLEDAPLSDPPYEVESLGPEPPSSAVVRYPGRPPPTKRKKSPPWCTTHPWEGRYPGGRPVVCKQAEESLQLTRRQTASTREKVVERKI